MKKYHLKLILRKSYLYKTGTIYQNNYQINTFWKLEKTNSKYNNKVFKKSCRDLIANKLVI